MTLPMPGAFLSELIQNRKLTGGSRASPTCANKSCFCQFGKRGKQMLPSFLYQGLFQPFSAAETEQIQGSPDAPIGQHADIDAHKTQGREQGVE